MPRYDDDDDDDLDISSRRGRSRDEAAARVFGPGLALMICAIISMLSYLVYCPFNMYVAFVNPDIFNPGQAQFKKQEEKIGEYINAGVAVPLMSIASVAVAVGAYMMMYRSNYAGAMTAAVISVIPCCSPCCIIGIPFGIWALVVLNDPAVKNSFGDER